VNHAVVAVGYAQDGNISYYYIRNSWGESWYVQLYFIIASSLLSSLQVCSFHAKRTGVFLSYHRRGVLGTDGSELG